MPPELTDDTTVVAAAEPVSTSVDGEEVILHPGTGQYHGLNGVGTAIWSRIDEPVTVTALVSEIAAEYDAPTERVRPDVEAFLRELQAQELIRVDAAPA